MLTELALTHPCAEIVYWCSGAYLDRRRHPITQCPRCFAKPLAPRGPALRRRTVPSTSPAGSWR